MMSEVMVHASNLCSTQHVPEAGGRMWDSVHEPNCAMVEASTS